MQFIEGLDNEVSFVLLFFTLLLVVVIPMYVMKPRRRNNREGEQQEQENNRNTTDTTHLNSSTLTNDINTDSFDTENSTTRTSDIPVSNPSENENASSQNTIDDNGAMNAGNESSDSTDMITIRVMLHETSQEVTVSKDMMLKDLKKKCFPTEYEAQRSIRLIYTGRVLEGDTYPLRYLRIVNGSVLHAVISTSSQTNESTTTNNVVTPDLDLSEYLLPLVSVMVFGSWSFVFAYSAMFSATTITILGFLTIVFVGFSFYSV